MTGFDRTTRRAAYQSLMSIPNPDGGVAEQNRLDRTQALAESATIQAATAGYVPTVTYTGSYLGFQLSEVAKIISANVGARALAVGINGFDTHSDQNSGAAAGQLGSRDALLGEVSDAIGAFYADLVNLGLSDHVLILTISEFGRRAYENGDKGTDHGFGSVCFAIGDDVQGGIYGLYPSLSGLVLDGNLAQTTDFRSVYATTLASYLGVDPVRSSAGIFR